MAALRIRMQDYPGRPGTIGFLARDATAPGSLFLVSAAHVLCPIEDDDTASVRRKNIHIYARLPGAAEDQPVATLFDWQKLYYDDRANAFDVGVAQVLPEAEQALLANVPLPSGVTGLVEENWDICMHGAKSGQAYYAPVRERQVEDLVLDYSFTERFIYPRFAPENHYATGPVSRGGDSGAGAFDRSGRLAGVLLGGRTTGGGRSYFARVGPILARFQLQPVLHSGSGVSAQALWQSATQMPDAAAALKAAAAPPAPAGAAPALDEAAVDVLARTLWGEARGEGRDGMAGVASVVLNRVHLGKTQHYWWGATVRDVCKRPYQFSCWNAGDPNRPRLLAVTTDDAAFGICLTLAREAVGGKLNDTTDGATHYHVEGIRPKWALGKSPCKRIGRHLFYRDIG